MAFMILMAAFRSLRSDIAGVLVMGTIMVDAVVGHWSIRIRYNTFDAGRLQSPCRMDRVLEKVFFYNVLLLSLVGQAAGCSQVPESEPLKNLVPIQHSVVGRSTPTRPTRFRRGWSRQGPRKCKNSTLSAPPRDGSVSPPHPGAQGALPNPCGDLRCGRSMRWSRFGLRSYSGWGGGVA